MDETLCESLMVSAAESMRRQRQLESETQGDFSDYLAGRFAQLDEPMTSPLLDEVDALEAQLYGSAHRAPGA